MSSRARFALWPAAAACLLSGCVYSMRPKASGSPPVSKEAPLPFVAAVQGPELAEALRRAGVFKEIVMPGFPADLTITESKGGFKYRKPSAVPAWFPLFFPLCHPAMIGCFLPYPYGAQFSRTATVRDALGRELKSYPHKLRVSGLFQLAGIIDGPHASAIAQASERASEIMRSLTVSGIIKDHGFYEGMEEDVFWASHPGEWLVSSELFQEALDRSLAGRPPSKVPEKASQAYARAKRLEEKGDWRQASIALARATRAAPWWPDPYYEHARVLARLKAPRWAAVDLKRYLLLKPDAPNADGIKRQIESWKMDGFSTEVKSEK